MRNADGKLERRRFKAQELLPVGNVRRAADTVVQRQAEAKTSHASRLRRSGLFDSDAAVRAGITDRPVVGKRVRKVPQKLQE